VELTPKERDRLRALSLWQESKDVKHVCRTFQMSQATLYRWRKRFDPHDIDSLKEHSRRSSLTSWISFSGHRAQRKCLGRETYPRWGKDKLVVLGRSKGHQASTSTVGRILSYLKQHGRLVEPKRPKIRTAQQRRSRPYAVRKPKHYHALKPGDLLELDTLDVRPLPKVILKQLTARDVVCFQDIPA